MNPPALVQRLATRRTEASLQAAVLGVFRAHGIVCWPMNREKGGRNRAVHVGFKGLPDIGGVLPGGRAMFAEVKRPGATLSPHQVGALEMLGKQGAFVCVVRSVEEAREHAALARRNHEHIEKAHARLATDLADCRATLAEREEELTRLRHGRA